MNNLNKYFFSILIILTLGCSSDEARDSNDTQEDVFNLKDSQESFKFEPVASSNSCSVSLIQLL